MLQGTGVRRRLGVFILVMVLLVFIDWGIVLFFHFDAPPLYRLVILACPGNGFSAFCAPLGLFAFLLSAGTVVTALFVNLARKRRRDREGLDSGTTGGHWETNLTFFGSLVLTVAYAESLVFFFVGAGPLGPDIDTVLTKVISPLLILVFLATGLHLLGMVQANSHPSAPTFREPAFGNYLEASVATVYGWRTRPSGMRCCKRRRGS